jgi:lysophospholipase L1-like esterase
VSRIVAACLVSALVGAALYRSAELVAALRESRGPAGPYSANLVDRLGAPLTRRQGQMKFVLDPWTTYRTRPNQRLPYLTIDADGYRVTGSTAGREGRTAVILGASAAFGYGLSSDEETFPAQLARRRPALHVVNAATVGFLSGQELAEMVHYADRRRPALYVVFDGWNEVHAPSAGAPGYGLGYNWQMLQQVEEQLHKAIGTKPAAGTFRPEIQAIAQTYVDNLDRMQAFARARGAEILFVFQPHLSVKLDTAGRFAEWRRQWYTGPFDAEYEQVVAHAVRACNERGWSCLDMSNALPSADLFIDPVHPNPAGHARIAELLAPIFGGETRTGSK